MPPQPDDWGERLPRSLGLWSAIAVLIGSTIGSGIFRVPAGVAARLGEPGPVLLAWVLGGCIALFGALTYAELAAAMPRSGGVFAYLLEGFGPLPAFLFGWSELTVIRASALGAISTIFAEYLGLLHPALTGAGALRRGRGGAARRRHQLRRSATSCRRDEPRHPGQVRRACGTRRFSRSPRETGASSHFTPAWTGGVNLSLIRTALIAIMWTYDGWADLSFMGGEVKDPARTFPLALILGTAGIVLVYLLINVAYIYLVPLPEMASAKLVAATAADHIPLLAGAGGAVVSAIVMVSCFGGLNGSMMTGPRIFFAMADRGLFFRRSPASRPASRVRRWPSGSPPRSASSTSCSTTSSSSPTSSSWASGRSTRSRSRRCSFCVAPDRTCRGPTGHGAIRWFRFSSCSRRLGWW